MGSFGTPSTCHFWYYVLQVVLMMVLLSSTMVVCSQYKVGDMDSWGIPTSANPQIYTKWPKNHSFKIGDSILFLYPPSQDSVIQVTEESYNSCNLKDPILYMNNGNSLFNVTSAGDFYFTSGAKGHCEKKQKLHISVLKGSGSAASPTSGPTSALSDSSAPSYTNVFGSIPAPPSSAPPFHGLSVFIAVVLGFGAFGFLVCNLNQGHIEGSPLLLGLVDSQKAEVGIQVPKELQGLEEDVNMVFSVDFMEKLVKHISKMQFTATLNSSSHVKKVDKYFVDVVPTSPNSFEFSSSIYGSLNACSLENVCIMQITD